jgi:predicted nucleic acid-binding protein
MATTYTVDASVFVNAFVPTEADHEQSQRLLVLLQANSVPMVVPTLLLPEVAATIARSHGDALLAQRFVAALARLPNLILVPLDLPLARQAVQVAADHRLRGADAIYVAVALRFGCILVSLDREQLNRVPAVLTTRHPSEVLADWA